MPQLTVFVLSLYSSVVAILKPYNKLKFIRWKHIFLLLLKSL